MTYRDVEEFFNSMEDPSAQERIDRIVPYLISLLPPPFVPAPETEDGSDDDDHFSPTSSDSEASDIAADPNYVPAAPGDGEDHISRLPDALLSSIIFRLPTKEAARTMALSRSWRGVWAATPLLVEDAHLKAADGPRQISVVRSISHCVAAYPGPVRGVRVTRVSFYGHEYALRRLVAGLAAKNVEDLILFNCPWPLDMPLPDDILHCASLSRLYLGVWRFPDTAARPPAFANLRELGLFHTVINDGDFDALLAHCPKLEVLSLAMAYHSPSRLHVASRSLRVAVEWMSYLDEVVVDDAPCLERLLLKTIADRRPVKIVRAPRLEVLGFLDLQLHVLEIGGIAIRAGMKVRASAMVPSLKILAVAVWFSHEREAKMLPTLLKCFPRLETLHIMSIASESTGVDGLEFWESLGSCECLESHLKTVVLHGFLSQNHEPLFLRYVSRKGKTSFAVMRWWRAA